MVVKVTVVCTHFWFAVLAIHLFILTWYDHYPLHSFFPLHLSTIFKPFQWYSISVEWTLTSLTTLFKHALMTWHDLANQPAQKYSDLSNCNTCIVPTIQKWFYTSHVGTLSALLNYPWTCLFNLQSCSRSSPILHRKHNPGNFCWIVEWNVEITLWEMHVF